MTACDPAPLARDSGHLTGTLTRDALADDVLMNTALARLRTNPPRHVCPVSDGARAGRAWANQAENPRFQQISSLDRATELDPSAHGGTRVSSIPRAFAPSRGGNFSRPSERT